MPYAQYVPKALVPSWMRGTWWSRWWTAIGTVLDGLVTSAKWAVKARFPDVTMTATDGLDAIGGDRLLPRGNTPAGPEADAAYAPRLQSAWGIWGWAGTANGVLQALGTAGYSSAMLMTVGGVRYYLSAGVIEQEAIPQGFGIGSWMTRHSRTFWSEFQVLFSLSGLPTPSTTGALSDWTVALPASNSDEINMLCTLIKRWRPGFGRCAGIVAVTAGACFGYPFENWETASGDNWGGDAVTLYAVD